MAKNLLKTRSGILLLLLVSLCGVGVAGVWVHFVGKYFEYTDIIVRLNPLMSRLLGMQQSEDTLLAANARLSAELQALTLQSKEGSDAAAAELQGKVRALAEDAGMSVSGTQVLPVKVGEGFERISLTVNLTGEVPTAAAMLGSLSAMQPRVIITSTQISSARGRRGEQRVNLRLTLLALRLLP
ncbi:MAG: type II secretion system protein GspM [Cellvibrionaceae bacterium]|nr:type II secretion system protein GspM [Cellvibrionaceae bacterium]MCV6627080.1 type II secretion system protein GspM [Cellvibrionaceae bacterium]